MRLPILILAMFFAAKAVAADPIRYTFSGTMSGASKLTRADDSVVDLSGVAFTAIGTTGEMVSSDGSVFFATTTYDFGALGSFTTAPGDDRYVQWSSAADPSGTFSEIGLLSWRPGYVDLIGFLIQINPVSFADSLGPVPVGSIDPLSTLTGTNRNLFNAAGDHLYLRWNPFAPLRITSAEVVPVPEPSTMLLASLGALVLARRRARRRNTSASVEPDEKHPRLVIDSPSRGE